MIQKIFSSSITKMENENEIFKEITKTLNYLEETCLMLTTCLDNNTDRVYGRLYVFENNTWQKVSFGYMKNNKFFEHNTDNLIMYVDDLKKRSKILNDNLHLIIVKGKDKPIYLFYTMLDIGIYKILDN